MCGTKSAEHLLRVEMELKKRCDKSGNAYFNKYCEMKQYLIKDEYPYIRDANPWFNDHGYGHAQAIIKTIDTMISKYLIANNELRNESREASNTKLYFSDEDIYVLLSACIWHDVAMIYMREGHGDLLVKYGPIINSYVHNKELTECILEVACSHSSKEKFHNCPLIYRTTGDSPVVVQVKLLASILRFADEICEDKSRATTNQKVIERITDTANEIYWRHSLSIIYSQYCFEDRKVCIDYEVDIEYAYKKYKMSEANPDNTKTLVEFIINRIRKVNEERILCSPFFSTYCPVDSIDINIKFYEYEQGFRSRFVMAVPSRSVSSYPQSAVKESDKLLEFIKAYPEFDPKLIEEELHRRRGV